jgi:UDP-glucose 4-epimerase
VKIFITGIAGFLGSHLADALIADGHEVHGNDNFICGDFKNIPAKARFTYFNMPDGSRRGLDCREFNSLKEALSLIKPDVVVHCAATAAEGFSVFSPSFITKNIYEASVSVFSAAIAAGAKRIVNMSSMARYGNGQMTCWNEEDRTSNNSAKIDLPFRESHETKPIDPYGIAKVAAEQTLKVLCETHDVKWTTAVPHNIIGTKQEITPYRNVVSIFLNRLKLGLPVYIYGDGNQKRCFSPVKDCLHSLVKMVDGAADGEVVNIGPDGGEITINELLSLCEKVTGIVTERVYLPPRPVTDTVKEAYCSSDKARRLLGFEPQQSLEDCIAEMAAAMKPKIFDYSFPIEIESDKLPRTWREKL